MAQQIVMPRYVIEDLVLVGVLVVVLMGG